ncbi:MAG: polysaccharide deacetylase family protein [Clostridia bacterium]|nr:polysaccharide deacetylase family protein [Clostridia bacterium]
MKRTTRSLKTVFALILALLLLAGTFTGCASEGSTEEKTESSTSSEKETSKQDEITLAGNLNIGGRDLLTQEYEVDDKLVVSVPEYEMNDDDPMAKPEPTVPPVGTDCGAKLIALTFDDGPTNVSEEFVAALNELDVDCTFFMLGYLIETYPDAVRAMVEGGHQIASHSYDHPNLKTSSQDVAFNQLATTENLLKNIDGKTNHYIRCPYGESGDYVKSIANAPLIYWSVDTEDWKSRDADAVYNSIMTNAYDGCIILCHDIYESTRQGTLRAIPELKAAGYEFVTVEELLKRRAVDIQNGTTYYDAQNSGTTYPDNVVPLTFGSFAENMPAATPTPAATDAPAAETP